MKLFSSALLDELSAKATASPRGRANHNIHIAADDPVQRFFVVANRQSYFRPHRHRTKSELAFVIRGGFDVLTFDESGRMLARYVVDAGGELLGYETPRATWHTLIARADGSAFLEIKEGPYRSVNCGGVCALGAARGRRARTAIPRAVASGATRGKPALLIVVAARERQGLDDLHVPLRHQSLNRHFLLLAHDFQLGFLARLIGGEYPRGMRTARRLAAINR